MAGAVTKVVLHGKGFQDLLQSPEIQADLKRRAEQIAAAAGEGMEVSDVKLTGQRARIQVVTATAEARKAEAVDRALTRAIDAGRT